MQVSPNFYLALSAAGFSLLWGLMLLNGTLDALFAVKEAGSFPNGRPLRLSYTGNSLVDDGIATLVSFFDVVTNGLAPGPRLMLINVTVLLHCASIWAIIDSRRRGVRSVLHRHPVPSMFLWNSFGGAVVLPLWCFFNLQSSATKRDRTIPLNEARAFPITTLLSCFFPLFLFAPAALNYPVESQHASISLFSATPLFLVAILVIASRPGATSLKDPKNPDIDAPYIIGSFVIAGLYGAAVHLYTIAVSLSTTDPDMTFTRLFIPSLGKVSPGSPNLLVEGAHLFGQFDWIIMAMACALYSYHMLSYSRGKSAPLASRVGTSPELEPKLELCANILATALLGPGATGSFALAMREYRLRKESVVAKQK